MDGSDWTTGIKATRSVGRECEALVHFTLTNAELERNRKEEIESKKFCKLSQRRNFGINQTAIRPETNVELCSDVAK